jgi:hypothetical protein
MPQQRLTSSTAPVAVLSSFGGKDLNALGFIVKADPDVDLYMDTYKNIVFVGNREEMLDHLHRTMPNTTGYTPEGTLARADEYGSSMIEGTHGHWEDRQGFAWPHDDRWLPRTSLTEFLRAYQAGGWSAASAVLQTHPDDRATR